MLLISKQNIGGLCKSMSTILLTSSKNQIYEFRIPNIYNYFFNNIQLMYTLCFLVASVKLKVYKKVVKFSFKQQKYFGFQFLVPFIWFQSMQWINHTSFKNESFKNGPFLAIACDRISLKFSLEVDLMTSQIRELCSTEANCNFLNMEPRDRTVCPHFFYERIL